MLFHNSPVEGQDGCGIVRHPMIRPGHEVELSHLQSSLSAAQWLKKQHTKYFGVSCKALLLNSTYLYS